MHFASAYPGTPSTEILEAIGESYPEVDSQWAPNEKVALETVAGASFGGARSLTAMKHVGLNVAADPMFTLSYIGATGGVVIVSSDDPGMHSSQNEQDNRNLAKAAKIPMLEPSDSNEAKEMVGVALEISERFDTPVMLRLTTRLSHSKSLVRLGPRNEVPVKGYEKDIRKRVPIPANARKLHAKVEKRMLDLVDYGNSFRFNIVEEGKAGSSEFGIITSGVSYQYVREVFPDVGVLRLGLTNPLPWKLIEDFVKRFDRVLVVEEGDPYLEEQIRARLLIPLEGKQLVPIEGELSPSVVRSAADRADIPQTAFPPTTVPARPPALCPGCPHRGAFYALSKIGASSTGDIGCYTLGLMPPHEALETVICMGGAVTILNGLEKAVGREATGKLVAAIGDSTFVHSGITGLIDMVYNGGTGTIMIMDNSITAMTGGQQHPGTGYNLKGEPAPRLDFELLCRACGVQHVRVVDPHDLQQMEAALREELAREEPSVIVTRRPCIMVARPSGTAVAELDEDKCVSCRMCMKVGCPAISFEEEQPAISPILCYPDCNLCVQVCPTGALQKDPGGEG